jgi:hypothetical protein
VIFSPGLMTPGLMTLFSPVSPGPATSQHGIAYSTRTVSSSIGASRHRGSSQGALHVLSISASVTRVRWRPLSSDPVDPEGEDRHESMIAVATAPIKGASAGGAGTLALWSWKRPYMPLSVVVGHEEGAVTDFHWLDTPTVEMVAPKRSKTELSKVTDSGDSRRGRRGLDATASSSFTPRASGSTRKTMEVQVVPFDESEPAGSDMGIWQHVLSVGRDGRCLIQSLARGTLKQGSLNHFRNLLLTV